MRKHIHKAVQNEKENVSTVAYGGAGVCMESGDPVGVMQSGGSPWMMC